MNTNQYKILLVDDDVELCGLLTEYLHGEGFLVAAVHSGQAALDVISAGREYSAIVLDIMMPQMTGLEVLQSLRSRINIPVIMLTGRGDDIDRILGLEMGADDYLGKPCNPRELAARLRAVLRRSESSQHQRLKNASFELHGICINISQRTATIAGKALDLTGAEFNTLALLMQFAGSVLSKAELTDKVLNRKLVAYDRSIDVHVSRVRQKLAAKCSGQNLIKTVRGQGYLFMGEGEG